MELIHTTEDIVFLYHLKNILETAGVESVIKNDRLLTISGEIPMTNCWPELWITDDSRLALSMKILHEVQTTGIEIDENEVWVCDRCGEMHSKQFSDCWNCHSIENEKTTRAF